MSTPQLSPFGSAVAGALGGVIANSIVYPLDTVKTRVQAESDAKKLQEAKEVPSPQVKRNGAPRKLTSAQKVRVRDVIRHVWRDGGIAGFYRGYSASMLNTFSMQFAYFYWYTVVRGAYVQKLYPGVVASAVTLSTAAELILGALAGALGQVFTIPVSVVATRQQLDDKSQSLLATTMEIIRDDGITGLWTGLKASLVLTVNPALTYGSFERLKPFILGDSKMTPRKAFVLGALSKTIATIITFPYILAKVRLQAKFKEAQEEGDSTVDGMPLEKAKRPSGALEILGAIYKQKGFRGWYQGMQAHIFKAVLAQALLFGIKDALEEGTIALLLHAAKFHGRPGLGLKHK
ncbi:mitochondrial carrier [Cystobasidium minutum MCA 4210]|uniref:mitochondrial carrier n=1 Tax=Cystobasidium minutum MCA 4210 TaxID=1397322 RepID=UPI0034CEA8B9|eukprot:jgi/Rhomi1/56005/CE56004_1592